MIIIIKKKQLSKTAQGSYAERKQPKRGSQTLDSEVTDQGDMDKGKLICGAL